MPSSDGTSIPFSDPIWYSRNVSAHYNESHVQFRNAVRDYVDSYVTPNCAEWERLGSIPFEARKRHAQLGYAAASIYPLANEYLGEIELPGGISKAQWDGYHDLILMDEMARCGYLGVVWGLACGNIIGCPPVINYGTREQHQRFLPAVMRGETCFCLGVTEPDAGSDVAGIQTTAERRGDVYVVNGAKKWITNGIFADYCTAAVRTGSAGRGGVSALVIPLGTKGVSRRKMENSGVGASGSTYLEFDEVEVPVQNLLGKENHGFEIIMSNFNHERLWLAATSLRLARVCVADAYSHAVTRHTFGKALIENQTIRTKLSKFGLDIEPAHAFMEQLVHLYAHNADVSGPTALLKVMAGQILERTVREAQQIFGGLGYSKNGRGARVEQISRDVRVMVVGGGSEEILTELSLKQETRALKQQAEGKSGKALSEELSKL